MLFDKNRAAGAPGVTAAHEPLLARLSRAAVDWTGTSAAFWLAVLVVAAWLLSGPFFHYSNTWQLVINTGTTIVTFLMVFLIQRAQNKDSRAVHLKLNELVAAMKGASNRLINVESLSEDEINVLHAHFDRLVQLAKADKKVTQSHSVEEAVERHNWKKAGDD
jgi:low affinity Fe/Cu permease